MAEALGVPRFENPMILEGGALDVNGQGVLLTTASCLLNPNRNPGLTRSDAEAQLQAYLGVRQVAWLGGELAGDDTDGHIDNLARFVRDDTIVAILEADPSDVNYTPLRDNLARLHALRGPGGAPFRIVELPMPAPVYLDGQRLPASYANFYVGNAVVLLPHYGDPHDAVAADLLQTFFPNRKVVGLDCREIVWGLGAFHCLSQQVPTGGGVRW